MSGLRLPKLVLFCGAIVLLAAAFVFVIHPWYQRWGATATELQMALPGDELLPDAVSQATRAITIRARAESIYPWLVQMGQNRGGLYSYEWLENLAGSDIHNVDRIVPEWQTAGPGDKVTLGPFATLPYYVVESVESGRALVLQSCSPKTGEWGGTWQFYLDSRGDGTTRLIVRHRDPAPRDRLSAVINAIFEPISFVMERGMMRGIRQRAEAATPA